MHITIHYNDSAYQYARHVYSMKTDFKFVDGMFYKRFPHAQFESNLECYNLYYTSE